jgi:CRISPR/Cas system CSM-associated protein Csm2 small subunit
VPFHAFELDPLEQSIDKSIKMNLEESLSVSIDSKYSDLSVQNEPEILQALKHLERDKPEEAPTEEYIFYLSQMKYLLYQMKIIRSKKEYSNLYNIISDTLEEVIRQFSAEKDDEALVKRVINIAGVIGKSNENSLEIERARQRVTKNISNAINSIQDIDCRSFFKNNLKIGFSSEYTPPSNFRHEWVLYTEE